MKIFEVDSPMVTPRPDELLGLVDFLSGRATDQNARKEISQDAFISLAQSLQINVNRANLPDLTNQPPLNTVLEPLQPNSQDPIVYKNAGEQDVSMSVPVAQQVVANAAKSAMKKDRGV
jgi:hypothetical protein